VRLTNIGPRAYRGFLVLSLVLAVLPATPLAQTFTVNAGMPVRIELTGFCSVSASDLNFGAYASNQDVPARAQSAIQLQCSSGTVAELSLDAGQGAQRNTKRRQMLPPGGAGRDRVDYDLFQDPGRTIHWGDNSGRDTLEVQTTGALQTIPVYGEIPGRQRVSDGVYNDLIVVQVFF
jgi:spore coat protein U-like protein